MNELPFCVYMCIYVYMHVFMCVYVCVGGLWFCGTGGWTHAVQSHFFIIAPCILTIFKLQFNDIPPVLSCCFATLPPSISRTFSSFQTQPPYPLCCCWGMGLLSKLYLHWSLEISCDPSASASGVTGTSSHATMLGFRIHYSSSPLSLPRSW